MQISQVNDIIELLEELLSQETVPAKKERLMEYIQVMRAIKDYIVFIEEFRQYIQVFVNT